MCDHHQFYAEVSVARLTETEESEKVTGFRADVKIRCVECQQEFEFIGVPQGYHVSSPTINIDGTELRLPIKPAKYSEPKENKVSDQQIN
jgi:hypothetical protein